MGSEKVDTPTCGSRKLAQICSIFPRLAAAASRQKKHLAKET